MATIINNPSGTEDSSAGVVIGILAAIVLVILFIMFVWPSISGRTPAPTDTSTPGASTNINVELPPATPGAGSNNQ